MAKIKYQVGCVINNCELLSRDYKTSANGSWVATFKCLNCGETFQNRINRVVDGVKNCSCGKKVLLQIWQERLKGYGKSQSGPLAEKVAEMHIGNASARFVVKNLNQVPQILIDMIIPIVTIKGKDIQAVELLLYPLK